MYWIVLMVPFSVSNEISMIELEVPLWTPLSLVGAARWNAIVVSLAGDMKQACNASSAHLIWFKNVKKNFKRFENHQPTNLLCRLRIHPRKVLFGSIAENQGHLCDSFNCRIQCGNHGSTPDVENTFKRAVVLDRRMCNGNWEVAFYTRSI